MSNAPFIRRVRLRNYKSIVECDVELGRFTILVGRNGSGKSNFLDAISFLSDSLNTSLINAAETRGRMRSLLPQSDTINEIFLDLFVSFELAIGLRADYEVSVAEQGGIPSNRFEQLVAHESNGASRTIFRSDGGKLASEVLDLSKLKIPFYSLALPLFGEDPTAASLLSALRQFRVYDPQPKNMRRSVQVDDALLEPDGANAASVMLRLQEIDDARANRLAGFLSVAIDDFDAIGVRSESGGSGESKTPSDAWLNFYLSNSGNRVFSYREVSDGTLRAFAVLLAAMQRRRNGTVIPVIGIEEPETGLHPAACAAMMEGLREASIASQILLTTHSPDILDGLGEEDVLLVVKNGQAGTRIGPPTEVNLSVIRDHLYSPGELLRMDHLEPAVRTEQQSLSAAKGSRG